MGKWTLTKKSKLRKRQGRMDCLIPCKKLHSHNFTSSFLWREMYVRKAYFVMFLVNQRLSHWLPGMTSYGSTIREALLLNGNWQLKSHSSLVSLEGVDQKNDESEWFVRGQFVCDGKDEHLVWVWDYEYNEVKLIHSFAYLVTIQFAVSVSSNGWFMNNVTMIQWISSL